MFELLELDPRFNIDNTTELRSRAVASGQSADSAAATFARDDGQLTQGETLLLLAALSSVLGSLWLTLNAVI